MLFDTIIDAFIMAANQHEPIILAIQLFRFFLRERRAGRGEQNDATFGRLLRQHRFARLKERATLHEHPRAAAAERVIDMAMTIVRKIPRIRDAELQKPRRPRAPDDTLRVERFDKFRKEGNDIDFHAASVNLPTPKDAPSSPAPPNRRKECNRESPECRFPFRPFWRHRRRSRPFR